MTIADFRNTKEAYYGKTKVKEVYYGKALIWKKTYRVTLSPGINGFKIGRGVPQLKIFINDNSTPKGIGSLPQTYEKANRVKISGSYDGVAWGWIVSVKKADGTSLLYIDEPGSFETPWITLTEDTEFFLERYN